MSAYTKLFQSIITSTLWRESPETKVVWVTMMALADKHGIVEASVPGLAALSHVSIEECEEALNLFMSPDKWSRTPDNEGRRIAPVDGGWELLNHEKYRLKMTEDERREYERLRKQRQRDRNRSVTERDSNGASQNVRDMSGTQRGLSPTTDQKGPKTPFVPHSEEEEPPFSEEERDISPSSKAHPAEPGPLTKEFLAAWNSLPPVFPRIQALTGKRRTALKARMGDPRWRSQWRTALDQMKTMPFCTGDNDRGWVGNPDWFLRPDTVTKIVEGQYGGNGKPSAKAPPKYSSDTGPKERALKEREARLREELPDEATAEAMRKELEKLKGRFPTSRTEP